MDEWTREEEASRLAKRFEGVNRDDFARTHCGWKNGSTIYQHITNRRPISMEAAIAYATGFGVPLEEISPRLAKTVDTAYQLGDEATIPLEFKQHPAPYLNEGNIDSGPDIRGDVPVISWVRAGSWFEVADPYEPGIADDWRPCPKNHSSRTFALRVRGVSMENLGGKISYSDGDIIFVDPERHYENGSRVIVRLENAKEATFKQLVIEGDKKYLKALNPAWPEKIIEIDDHAVICGVVIGKWTDE